MNNSENAIIPFPASTTESIEETQREARERREKREYRAAVTQKEAAIEALAILSALLSGLKSFHANGETHPEALNLAASVNVPFLRSLTGRMEGLISVCDASFERLEASAVNLKAVIGSIGELEADVETLPFEGFQKIAAYKEQFAAFNSSMNKREQEWKECILKIAPLLYPMQFHFRPVLDVIRRGKAEIKARAMANECKQSSRLSAWHMSEDNAERIAAMARLDLLNVPKTIWEFYLFALAYLATAQALLNDLESIVSELGGEIPSVNDFRGFTCPCGCNAVLSEEARLERFA